MAHMCVDPKVLCENYFTIEKHIGENLVSATTVFGTRIWINHHIRRIVTWF